MSVSYFEGTDFRSDIRFRKFRAQIPKFGRFGPNSINFLILTKLFYIYLNSTAVMSVITFEKKSTNLGMMEQNLLTHLREIFLRYWFQVWNFFLITNSKRRNNRITQFRQCGTEVSYLLRELHTFFDQDKLFRILVLSS